MALHIEKNRSHWDTRVEAHVKSEFYDHQGFVRGRNSLKEIELDLLGSVSGLDVLHLQCHFGQDTLSLARLGANVVGVDFSEKAIEVARRTNEDLGLNAEFICCEVFELGNHLDRKFDIVFASYGVIGWHPNMDPWARLVKHFLKPGGRHVLVEFHPTLWMWSDDFSHVQYSYFNTGSIDETLTESYADKESGAASETMSWNHSTSELLTAFLDHDLEVTAFREFDYSPFDCFQNTVESPNGYQIRGLEGKLPMVFAVEVQKN